MIVTEWRLAPGAETGWHRHSYDYVVVCLTAGTLVAETSTGNIETELQFGQTYTRPVGVEHNIINPGEKEFAFVEVELKYEGAAQQPANRCGALDMRLLDMNCQALALTGRGVASGLAG